MRSRILGRLELDHLELSADLAYLESVPRADESYDEFSNGYWQNLALWNASGDSADDIYRDVNQAPQLTEHGKSCNYLRNLVETTFDTSHLAMVRTRNLIDAVVIPHRDFVELDKPVDKYFRVLMFLEANSSAFHSNDSAVFNMQPGEVWFLDAASVHSAANFSANSRQMLCLDFVFDGDFDESDIFADSASYDPTLAPTFIARPELTESELSGILDLALLTNRTNFKEILFLLSKVHYSFDVTGKSTYDWLSTISERTGDVALIDKARRLTEYAIEARGLTERFNLNSWTDRAVAV
ncbi:aspartyl/asparaginyl beta-hydroxylase domain-containing protein [Rhodococcus qingshengii]|uniref:aspartyl/asparaginyl beta-hydroxylase domain-containing protein n=1 Tax=Rhodococcus qingshengii TaxID=334542 RepID=UPI0037C6FA20